MPRSIAFGPLLLLAWQVAPLPAEPDRRGSVRLSLGYVVGRYASTAERWIADDMSCAGGHYEHSELGGGWNARTAQLDVWPIPEMRATVSARDRAGGSGVGRRDEVSGLVAWEGRDVGLGAGGMRLAGSGRTVGIAYLRLGDVDGGHMRFELVPNDHPDSDAPWIRFAWGVNQGQGPGGRLLAGVAIGALPGGEAVQPFVEGAVPLAGGLELELGARVAFGQMSHESFSVTGPYQATVARAGVRYTFWRW